jgi:integrase
MKNSVGRYNHRDATLILLMSRHGLRVSEIGALRWNQIDLKTALASQIVHYVQTKPPETENVTKEKTQSSASFRRAAAEATTDGAECAYLFAVCDA